MTDPSTAQIIQICTDIAAVREQAASAHKRLDEQLPVTKSIHALAINVGVLAEQVKHNTEAAAASALRLEDGLKNVQDIQKDQGERLTEQEKKMDRLSHLETAVGKNAGNIEAIKLEPAHKWKSAVQQLVTLGIAAAVGGAISHFLG